MRNAVVVIAAVIAGAAARWMGDILTPLVLAVFLMVLIDSLARNVQARAPFLPRWAAMPVAIIVSVLVFVAVVYVIGANAKGIADQLPAYSHRLDQLIATFAARLGIAAPPSVNYLLSQVDLARLAPIASGLRGFGADAFFVLIYVGFLLASRKGFVGKTSRLFPHRGERADALFVFHRIRNGIEQYLWIQTVLGLAFAIASWAVMALLGLDNAIFWAFMIFVSSYIPIIGGAVGVVLPPLFALVQFTNWWPAAVLLGVLALFKFVADNVVLPRMQGATLNLDAVVVLLSLAFWGAIWGVPGMFLSTPLTVTAMIILGQFEGTRWIAVLLSGDGHPEDASRHERAPSE